jgi:hypothetical protein
MTFFIIALLIGIIYFLFFRKTYISESIIETIIEENYISILKLAENDRIICTYLNLNIEEGGHYPRYFHNSHTQIVKSAIRNYILNNTNLKIEDTNYLLLDYQKQEILQMCIQALKS